MEFRRNVVQRVMVLGALSATVGAAPATAVDGEGALGELLGAGPFRRVASFPVFQNTDAEQETVAEIVAVTDDGLTLIYTDSAGGTLGFVGIADPEQPTAEGYVELAGEPTSVAVAGEYALVCINTSKDFVNTSGQLDVFDIATRELVRSIDLGGQPDAIAVSPDGKYAAVAIENERDEDLEAGEPPQLPAGFLVIVDLVGGVGDWGLRTVELTGLAELYPEDPEPEFVDINAANVAVVTLQENNHIVVVFLPTGDILNHFSAGSVDLDGVDVEEDDLIDQSASLQGVPREPDAVAWISPFTFTTANEGDLFGGSRGFTNWAFWGASLFDSGVSLDQCVAALGHYPEDRSENKGNEPEGAEFGSYGSERFLFVGSERSNVVFVYQLFLGPILGAGLPVLRQVLPTGVGPEGLLAIPGRDLFVVACEVDARADKIRSSLMIYERVGASDYPSIVSAPRASGVPIPWGALSGLSSSAADAGTAYAVYDSFYRESRIFSLDVGAEPAVITDELVLRDEAGLLRGALAATAALFPGAEDFDAAALINADQTVNLDLEGVCAEPDGSFWVASEGSGNLVAGVSDPKDRPFQSPNALLHVAADGAIDDVVLPPARLTANQLRFGFEGVAAVGSRVYVAFQRAWEAGGDPAERARIGVYDRDARTWAFAYYPLDEPTSPNGGWVGLSELTYLGDDRFAVVERDNQGGPDATIKRVTRFSIAGVTFLPESEVGSFSVLEKGVVIDLLETGVLGAGAGLVAEKIEGLTVLANGDTLIVNDNDGVDDNSGETRLLRLEGLF